MVDINDMSSRSSSQEDCSLYLEEDTEALMEEANILVIESTKSFSDKSEYADIEETSGAWRQIEDIISF